MKTRIVPILITLLCIIMASVQSARAATIMVTNTNDSGPGSLRQALVDANDGDTIDATGVSGTILLTSGELEILTPGVTINGPGAGALAVNGNATFTVFVNFARDVTISGFTITNGVGGIINAHRNICCVTLTVSNCTISGNSADYGGGISNGFSLAINNSTISGNSAGYGGGIANSGGVGVGVTMSNSTLSGNLASVDGGGVYNSGGQRIDVAGLSIENSTISGNSAAGNGGGIYHRGSGFAIGSTILNAGASGGTIFNDGGTVTSLGYNLASDAGGGVLTGPGDQINTDPMLGPLHNNGGPTLTHALLPGSPAINAGDPSFTPPPFFDQRGPGFDRVVNGRLDIGSFEVQKTPGVVTNPATLIASFSATLNGSVDPHGLTTTVYFQYGTTTSYGLTTAIQSKSGNTYQNVAANLSGLAASTRYHFRIVATNSGGTRYGNDRTFTTLSATGPPVVITNLATNVTSSSATLNGSVDPHGLITTVYFQYGTTTNYGHTTANQTKTGNTYQNVAANISGLAASTTYHFRVVATNSAGTRFGSDRTFTTP